MTSLSPSPADQAYGLGAEAFHARNYEEAARQFRQSVELNPGHYRGWAYLGMSNAALGKVDEAIENYRKCIDLNGSYHKAFNNIGELYRRKGQLDYAVMVFKMATEMEGAQPHYFFNLGLAYGDVGMLPQSETSLRHACEMMPSEFDFATELSQVQFALQRFDSSIQTLKTFIAAVPGHDRVPEMQAKIKMLERQLAEQKQPKR